MSYFQFEQKRGVMIIGLDKPGDTVNTLDQSLMDGFAQALDRAEADPCRAVVLISLKKDNFIAGADIDMFRTFVEPGQAHAVLRRGHVLANRLAAFPKPVVAAIHGPALGAGLEVVLACHGRIASDDPKTALALPEVKLGLLPGLGGTQRLPRLIGLRRALDVMLTGKNVYARKARKIGLVDALIHPHGLADAAVQYALDLAERPRRRRRKRGWLDRLLESRLGRGFVFRMAAKQVRRQTHGNYPAPFHILRCAQIGLDRGIDKGLETEAELFDQLTLSPESRALVNLFFAMNAAKKNPQADLARPVRKRAVLGAGLMGAGIAQIIAEKGDAVVMKDLDAEALGRGERTIWKALGDKLKKRAITPFARDQIMGRVYGSVEERDLAGADLVIEAVFEDLALKRQMLAMVEARCAEDGVFASNTSSLPIAEIAAEAKRPERVIGMHYFSPVAKMPLLEIVVHEGTADWALATAFAEGARQGKHMIVVHDGPGFYTTRILGPMLNEAVLLLEEGADIVELDRAMVRFGFAVGPVALIDEVGIDVGVHVGRVLGPLFTARGAQPSQTLDRLFRDGYRGRKNGRGFYSYRPGKRKRVNAAIYRYFGGRSRARIPAADMQERLFLAMVNEAAHCLGEGVLRAPDDGDLGAILGLGFPPFLGGPFRYIDRVGADALLKRLEALQNRHGPRFAPAPIIADHVGKRFHGDS